MSASLSETTGAPLPWLTVERAALACILLGAASIRLLGLSDPPLDPDEAARALAAWRLGSGAPEWWQAPGLATALGGVFAVLGDGTLTARLVPAAAGVAVVGSPWLLRQHLGAPATLLACGLLAVSATGWAAARTVHEAAPAVLLAVAAGWLVLTPAPPDPSYRRPLLGVAVAGLLSLGAPGITGALALAAYLAVQYAWCPPGAPAPWPLRRPYAPFALPLIASYIFLASGALLHLGGFGFPSVAAWATLGTPAPRDGGVPSLAILGLLEPLALVVGGAAALATMAAWARRRGAEPDARLFLALWALVATVPLLTGSGHAATALHVAAYPLTVLAARAAAAALQQMDGASVRRLLAVAPPAGLLLVFGYMSLARSAALGPDVASPLLGVLALGGAALSVGLAALAAPVPQAVLAAAVLTMGGLWSVHSTGTVAAMSLRPNEAVADAESVQTVADLVRLQRYAEFARGRTLAVQQDLRHVLAWPLRATPNVAFPPAVEAGPDALIARTGALPETPAGYARTVLPLTRQWQPQDTAWVETWAWAVWGRPPRQHVQDERAALLVRR